MFKVIGGVSESAIYKVIGGVRGIINHVQGDKRG